MSLKEKSKFSNIKVQTDKYLNVSTVTRLKKELSITLSDHSYLPRIDDLESDWVAHVAVPAFKTYRQERNNAPIDSFCSIGTGSGLDVLSAIETLGANRVGLTDVHEDVVSTAADNIRINHISSIPLTIESGFGDLLKPLSKYNSRYDLIYENLPNVPLQNDDTITTERKSSTHVPPRQEFIPELIKNQMLDLHYIALQQAKNYLTDNGAILSILGARVPLDVFLSLGSLAGYSSSFLIYSWKVQADPEEVIRDHATKQKNGFGPFYFYRASVLQKAFASINVSESGKNALTIEKSLIAERLDAVKAYEALKNGERIGHTVAVLKSELK